MRITEQQLQFLYQIAMDSVKMNVMGLFCYPMEQRLKLVDAIMNQQSGEIIDMAVPRSRQVKSLLWKSSTIKRIKK